MTKQSFKSRNQHNLKYIFLNHGYKETICFIHGAGSRLVQYQPQIDFFKASFNILLVNLYGHDPNDDQLSLSGDDFKLEVLAEDISDLIHHLDIEDFHLVGHSAGGLVALEMIKQKDVQPLSLVTFGTAVKLNIPKFMAHFISRIDKYMLNKKPEKYIKFMINASTKKEAVKPVMTKIMLEAKQAAPFIRKHIGNYDYLETLKTMSIPYLMIEGSDDKSIIKANKKYRKQLHHIKQLTILPIEDAGHFTNLDQPERFNHELMTYYQRLEEKEL